MGLDAGRSRSVADLFADDLRAGTIRLQLWAALRLTHRQCFLSRPYDDYRRNFLCAMEPDWAWMAFRSGRRKRWTPPCDGHDRITTKRALCLINRHLMGGDHNFKSMRRRLVAVIARSLVIVMAILSCASSFAHGDALVPRPRNGLWKSWEFDPFVILGLFLSAALYSRGLYRLWHKTRFGGGVRPWEASA